MNTSNKILAGFFIVVFLVPVFIFMSFNSKIKKGEYKVVKNERYENPNFRSGTFKPYKVVKLISPPGMVLHCKLEYADSLYYNYDNSGSTDSIRIYNINDTVFVQYIKLQGTADASLMNELSVNMRLPSVESLIIDNAEVHLMSLDTSGNKNLSVVIEGNGLLNIGVPDEDESDKSNSVQRLYKLNQLSVETNNAQLALGKNINVQQLQLHFNGSSVLTIDDGAVIEEIQGNLSDSSSVKANWKYVKRLATFTEN